jgi:hypothetical protein
VNLSMSGGQLAVDLPVRMLSLVQIVIEAAPWYKESTVLSVYVTRTHGDRIGVEWSTVAPRKERTLRKPLCAFGERRGRS